MEQLPLFGREPQKRRKVEPKEWKVVALKDCPLPASLSLCDTPKRAVEYWERHIANAPEFDPEKECFIVLLLNTRRRVKGHTVASIGTLDSVLVHPREVFRTAIAMAAGAILLMHNHPSGEATPSEADIKVTRDMIRAGQLLKIDVVDHIIIGKGQFSSLRELGYFYA
jgi:DNA repair protein RadC